MIEDLKKRSDDTFALKEGTLYPLLHDLEEQGMVEAYEKPAGPGRVRKYYLAMMGLFLSLLRTDGLYTDSATKATPKLGIRLEWKG